MEKVSIRIEIRSFEQSAIETAIAKLIQLAQLQESINQCQSSAIEGKPHYLKIISRTTLPPSIRRFTVLRSPHIDKKSREQFQQKELAVTIGLRPVAISFAFLLLSLLKNSQLVGVQQRIRVTLATALYK
jgi:ribosomal protein S10